MTSKLHSEICVLLVVLLIAGATLMLVVSTERGGAATPGDPVAVQQTLRVASDISGMSEEEFAAYAEQMEQKYGQEAIEALNLHIPDTNRGASPEPDATPKIRYISAWNGTLEVRDDEGVVLAESDNALVLYALDLTDQQGRDHYYWWQWSAAQNREDTWMGDASNLRNFWSRVEFENATSNLLIYAPDSDIRGSEDTATIRFGIEFSDANCRGISRDFVLHQGKIRPKPGECQVGGAGKYAVEWVGNYEGTQSIYGICEERRENGAGSTVLWTYSLTASRF